MWGARNHEGYMDLTAYIAIKNAEKEKRKMSDKKISRGEIFMIEKPTGEQPAVVVSNDAINDNTECVMIVYLSDHYAAISETDVSIRARALMVAKAHRVYTVHRSKIGEYIRTCDAAEIAELDKALGIAFGLDREFIDPEDSGGKPEAEGTKNLKMMLDAATKQCKEIRKELDEAGAQIKIIAEDRTRAQVQRDLYKQLYDETLDKLLGAMA